jgi:hypothetical protein
MSNSLDVAFDLPSQEKIDQMFNMVPQLQRYKAVDKVVRAGAQVVAKRARDLTPRSTEEARKKRSRKQQSEADWNYPLWKTIKYIVRKYEEDGLAVVGPEWPKGNKAYFNTSPKGRLRVLWGRGPNPNSPKPLSSIAPQIRNWIVQAFDETRQEQYAAMRAALTKFTDELFSKNG